MKKFLILFLAGLFVLSGCTHPQTQQATPTETTAETQPATTVTGDAAVADTPVDITEFSVGYSSRIVNPDEPLPLSGYGNVETRYLKEIMGDIKIFVLAMSDGEGNDILWINTDLIQISAKYGELMQQMIHTETGVPVERIYISGNHSHSAPTFGSENERVVRYQEKFYNAIVEVSVEAMADRKPASLETGSVETENLNFVKHYQYVDENGETQYFGDNFGTAVYNDTTTHTTEADTTMHLLRITRDGCKDIVVANWRAHPHFTGGSSKYVLSSDYPGFFREAVEKQLGVDCIFMQGACGNINSSTRLAEERRTTDVRTFGKLLADYAIEGLTNNMTPIETGTIQTTQYEYWGEINHTFDDLYVQAKTVTSVWAQTNSWDECRPYMTPFGIRSPYHANAIVANYSRTTEKDGKLIMNAVSIGDDFAFVTFPGELFDAISVGVEEGSPFATTMLIGYSNGHIGYLPSAYAFEYTSYETDITRFAAGTGEIVRDQYIAMLNAFKEG